MKKYGVVNGECFCGQWVTSWFTTENQARNLYNLACYASIRDGIRPMPSLIEEEEEEVKTATVEECDEDDDWEPEYEWEDDWYEEEVL